MARNRAQQTRRQVIILLAAAVVLVGGALFYFLSQPEETNPTVQQEGRVAIPVAVRNLARGTQLTTDVIRLEYMPPALVPADAIIHLAEFNRRVLARNKRAGDYIRADDLGGVNAPGSYSGIITEGKRVIVLDASNITGTTGYLRVGDIVDVISISSPGSRSAMRGQIYARGMSNRGTFGFATSDGSQPGALSRRQRNIRRHNLGLNRPLSTGEIIAKTLVKGAEVLDVPRRSRRNQMNNVVLAVDKEDAEQLLLAQASGHVLRILFRPFNEEADNSTEDVVQMEPDPQVLEMITGSSRNLILAPRN
ncbi:MAG: Flp pilus assembly protein CpaB [Thiotrichales bacterium]|nr:Flp pilus assembly protein CpaB [Thiotrichales bacterium]